MKIVVILSRFPWPLEKGDKLRAFHFIRLLSEKHEIHLFALTDRMVTKEDVDAISPFCATVRFFKTSGFSIVLGLLRSLMLGLPFQVGYFYNRSAKRSIRNLVSRVQPGLVFCQLVRVAEYVRHLPVRKMLDYQDALSLNMARRAESSKGVMAWLCRNESRRLSRYETRVFDQFEHKIIISEPDKQAIAHPDRERIIVVPNGVDYAFFSPQTASECLYDVVFTGNMSYAPNVEGALWLAREIMPELWKELPEAKLLIAGSSPLKPVLALAGEKVIVSGWMPDIREAYRSSRVFVAPMATGSGLQNKLLEAMSMKLPCVTTSLANSSLLAADGSEILVADSTDAVAKAIIRLLRDPLLAGQIAEAGHVMVRTRFRWTTIMEGLENEINHQHNI